jgi:hypothetical protein
MHVPFKQRIQKRRVISLLDKVEVLDKLGKEKNTATVRHHCGVNE